MKILINRLVLLIILLLVISTISAQPAVTLTVPADNEILFSPDVTFTWEGLPGTATQYTLKIAGVGFTFSYTKALYPNAAGCKTTTTCIYIPADLTLKNNKTYRWFVIAKTSGGQIKSTRYDFSTAFPKPGQPTLTAPGHDQTVEGNQPTFEWQMGADTQTSQLRVFDAGNVLIFSRNLSTAGCSGDVCAVTMADFAVKLPKKGSYTWWVRGKNPYGQTKSLVHTFVYEPSIAYQMLALVNAKRCNLGLAPVALNPQLNAAAQRHSDDMAANNSTASTGSDGSTPAIRIYESGYPGTPKGEIRAGGGQNSTAQAVFKQWWGTAEMKAYFINPTIREIGVAHAYNAGTTWINFWTVVFGAQNETVLGVC